MEYPRALPFNPPRQENTRPWRFWPHVTFLLVLVIAAEYWLLAIRGQAALPQPEPALEKEEKSKPALNIPIATMKKSLTEEGKPTPAALAGDKLLLESLGALSASQVCQSYLNIGMLGDAVAHQAYAEQDAYAILTTLTGLLQMMDRQLDNVAKVIVPEDQQALGKIRRLNRLLQAQADALAISWETGDPKKEEEYLQVRGESWKGIQEILGIE